LKNDLSVIIQGILQFDYSDIDKKLAKLQKELTSKAKDLKILIPIEIEGLEETKKQIAEIAKSFDGLDGLADAFDDISKGVEGLNEKLATATEGIGEMSGAAEGLGDLSAISDLSEEFASLKSDVKSTNKALSGTPSVLTEIGQAFAAIGLLKMIQQVTAALMQAVDASQRFEQSLAMAEKTTFSTVAEMGRLRDVILGMSEAIPQTINGIAAIVEQAGRLGIEGTDNIERFADTISRLSVTTEMTAVEASRVIAGFAAVVGMPVSEVDRLGSALSLLGNNVSISEGQIMALAHRMGSAGAAAGLSASEIISLSAALGHLQLSAEMGFSEKPSIVKAA